MSRSKFAVATVAETPEELESILAKALGELGVDPSIIAAASSAAVKTVTRAAKPTVRLRNRTIRKAGTFACERVPTPLMAAAILWPPGVPHKGCGRTFTTDKRRLAHEAGAGWDVVTFPNGCLDRILDADKRDTR